MIDLSQIQRKNYEYFEANLTAWLADPLRNGKFLVIHNDSVQGVFDTFQTAFKFAVDCLPHNEFIIQQVISSTEMVGYLHFAV